MAIAVVTGPTSAIDGGGTTASVNMTVTAGNTLVILLDWYHATSTVSSVTITSESNATILGSPQRNATISNKALQFAVLDNITASGSKTITATWSAGGDMRITVFEISGANTAGASDGTPQGANGTGTTASVSVTTATANAAMFALCSSNGSDPTQDTGYTLIALSNEQWFDGGEYNVDVGAAGAKTVQMTVSSAWTIAAAAFKPAGGGGGATVYTRKPFDSPVFQSRVLQ